MTTEKQAAQELMKATFWEAFWRGLIFGLLIALGIIVTLYFFADDITI